MINRWNPLISSVLRSNHDISFIPSTSKTLASVYYMTNYATKDDIKLHQVVVMAAVLRLSLEHAESEWLVASELEVHSSKCSVSYLRRLKRDLLGGVRGCCWLVGVRVGRVYCSSILVGCSVSISSRRVAIANLIVARTASIFGAR